MRMAPKPRRLTVTSPPSRTVPLEPAGRLLGLSFMFIPPESFSSRGPLWGKPRAGRSASGDAVAVEARRLAGAGTSARAEMSACVTASRREGEHVRGRIVGSPREDRLACRGRECSVRRTPQERRAMQATTPTPQASPPSLDAVLAWLRQQRDAGSIHHDEHGIWQVFGYADVERVLSDPAAFSSDFSQIMPAQRDFALFSRGNFVRMDPPKHRKLRGLVSQAFTPRMVSGLAPRIAELTRELLDGLGGAERFDLVDGLAYPLPVIVIAELLGIPVDDRPIFRQWAELLFSQNQQTSEIRLDEAELRALFDAVAPT